MSAPALPSALDAAKAARDRGWRPFPVAYQGKEPVGPWAVKAASEPTDQMLALWFGSGPRNVGIACKASGLLVVDDDEDGALERYAEARGKTLPITYRVRTARGWHWYFDAADYPHLGNSEGELKGNGMNVRGGGDNEGGFVVGAGSVHESGHVYVAEDEHVAPAPLPSWLARAIGGRTEPAPVSTPARPTSSSSLKPAGRTPFTWAHAKAYVTDLGKRVLESVEGGQNNALNDLCMALGHFVTTGDHPGHWSREEAELWAEDAATQCGYAQRDPRGMRATIRSGLDAGMRDPYPCAPDLATNSQPGAPAESDEERIARLVAERVESIEVDRAARREVAERERAGRPSLASLLIDVRDLATIPAPEMLLSGLIQRAGVGFLAGRWGSYKTFLAVSFACHLAAGLAWQSREEFAVPGPVRVLYVASEGAAGVAERVRAWEHVHGLIPAGMLAVYPRPIRLNSDTDVAELAELIAERGIGFVVIDTYHRSAPGTEENSSTEFGVVYEAVAAIRDEHGTTFLFNDHTGHAGKGPRGTTAKSDDADFVLMADIDGDDRGTATQRTLRVAKLKDSEIKGEWPIRLRPVPEIGDKGSAVIEVGPVRGTGLALFNRDLEWWHDEVPETIAERFARQPGRGAALDICRILNAINDHDGETPDGLRKIADGGPRRHSISTWKAGLALVKRTSVVGTGSTPAKLVLSEPWPVQRAE